LSVGIGFGLGKLSLESNAFTKSNLGEATMTNSKKAYQMISTSTDNWKWYYGQPNRKYLIYLPKYDRYHRNSNGKSDVFDHGELEESVAISLQQRRTTIDINHSGFGGHIVVVSSVVTLTSAI